MAGAGASIEVGFAIPEPLDRVSGGYLYDRAVAARLASGDVRLRLLGLPEGFPTPDSDALDETARRLAAWPGPLLIDGLALGAFPAALAAAVGPRSVALVHHPLGLETGLAPERAAALLRSERAALAAMRGVICTSADTARRLQDMFGVAPERIAVARPGVERPAVPAPRRGDPPVILAVGAITLRKNFHGLVRALAQVADLPWRLRVVGPLGVDPAAERALDAAIAETGLGARVALTGPVAEIGEAFRAADLFVSAALYEGFGMAMAEATAYGLPVVALAAGGAREAAPGAVVIDADPAESAPERLATALRPLLASREARDARAARALAAAADLPQWDETARLLRAALIRFFQGAAG